MFPTGWISPRQDRVTAKRAIPLAMRSLGTSVQLTSHRAVHDPALIERSLERKLRLVQSRNEF